MSNIFPFLYKTKFRCVHYFSGEGGEGWTILIFFLIVCYPLDLSLTVSTGTGGQTVREAQNTGLYLLFTKLNKHSSEHRYIFTFFK